MSTKYLRALFIHAIFAFTLVSISTSNVYAQNVLAAEIPTTHDVSSGGSFQYTVPLRVPPGIMNMVPELAITYNSQSGNGILGMGWTLTGISSITRGKPSIYHNQILDPIDFDNNDMLYLDGQKLWSSAGKYFTEVKNFADITFNSSTNSFTAIYPNGMTFDYGTSTDSRMLAQGKQDVFKWMVKKITDMDGNYILFEYTNLQSSGEYRISKITYAKNNNGAGNAITIDFSYKNRPDNNTAWFAGSVVQTNKLLEDIIISFSGGAQANKYHFTYDSDIRSRLTKIEELRDGTEVMPPININWGTRVSGITQQWNSSFPGGYNPDNTIHGDFNGDGSTDFIALDANGVTKLYTNNGSGSFTINTTASIPSLSGYFTFLNNRPLSYHNGTYFDYDGDGMDDLVMIRAFNKGFHPYLGYIVGNPYFEIWVYKANGDPNTVFGSGTKVFELSNSNGGGSAHRNLYFNELTHIKNGDFDGDGKTELLIVAPYNFQRQDYVEDYEVFVVGEEYPNGHQVNHFGYEHINGVLVLDYNGDGTDEFIVTNDQHFAQGVHSILYDFNLTYSAVGGGIFKPNLVQSQTQWPVLAVSTSVLPHTQLQNWFGDFNGDGTEDIISWNTFNSGSFGSWQLIYSDADYFGHYDNSTYRTLNIQGAPIQNLSVLGPQNSGGTSNGDYSMHIADFNGDGLDDILQLEYKASINQHTYHLWYSTGSGDFVEETGGYPGSVSYKSNIVGDYNGDGQADILYVTQYGWHINIFNQNNNSLYVQSIDHAGKTLNIEYETLPRDNDYQPTSAPTSAYLAETVPIKVAKRVYDDIALDNKYVYKGILIQKYGVGIRGFENVEIENKTGQKIYKTYNLTSTIPYMTTEKVFDGLNGTSYGILSEYTQLDINGGAGGRSHIILNYPHKVTNNIDGQITENSFTLGNTGSGTVFYDFGRIGSKEIRTKDLFGNNNSLETTTYDYGTNWVVNKGKPESIEVYKEIDPNGNNGLTNITNYTYYPNGAIESFTADPGTVNEKILNYTYNSVGNVIETELIASGIAGSILESYDYSSDERFVTQKQEIAGSIIYTTQYEYSSQSSGEWGNVIKETDKNALEVHYVYDALNRVIEMTDQNSVIHYTNYEWANTSQYSTSNAEEQFAVTTTSTANTAHETVITDKYGRTIRNIKTSFSGTDIYQDVYYNDRGLDSVTTSPYPFNQIGQATIYNHSYDDYNRETLKWSTSAPDIQTSYSIASGELETQVTNLATQKVRTAISCGSTLKRIYNTDEDIQYTYHGNGETATTTVNGLNFINQLDPYGRVIETYQPSSGTYLYEYDALNRVNRRECVGTGEVYEFDYDLLGRMTSKQQVQPTIEPPYDFEYENADGTPATGELIRETAPNGTEKSYTYTNQNQLQSITEKIAGIPDITTIYSYYSDGNLENIFYYNDVYIHYTYNFSGYLNEAELVSSYPWLPGHKLWHANDRDQYGQLEGAYYFDQNNNTLYASTNGFDQRGFPSSREVVNLSAGVLTIVDNTYDFDWNTGNLSQRYDMLPNRNLGETFSYDVNFDRLTSINPIGTLSMPVSVDYDNRGNILKKTDVANTNFDWIYNQNNYNLVTVPEPHTTNFEIPQNRQEISYGSNMKVERIFEQFENELIFTYGADDERVKAEYYDIANGNPGSQGGGTPDITKFYATNYERIVDASGAKTELNYVWAGDELIAILRTHTATPASQPTGAVYYTITDYQGSITHILDDMGNGGIAADGIIEERSYDAWGRVRDPNNWQVYTSNQKQFPTNNWTITDRGYTGHEHIRYDLWDNNIINMNGRIYDPLIGRMFSPDPVIANNYNSQDYNKYAYVRNNPLKYTDPSGETPIVAVAYIVAGVVGGGINVANNWHKIKNFEQGLAYFGNGAIGGMVSLTNPAAGVGVTAGANVVTDVIYGNVPEMNDLGDYAEYAGGALMDGLAVSPAGLIGNGVNKAILAARYAEYGYGAGQIIYKWQWIKDVNGKWTYMRVGTLPEYTHVAVNVGKTVATQSEVYLTKHAVKQMAERGVTKDMVKLAIKKGQKFFDPRNGSINYVLTENFASGKSLLVGTNPGTGNVTTVIRSSKSLVNKRFIPIQ